MSDISLLANSFLEQAREDARREVTGFADEALSALERYQWPGNVRELQNVIERAVLLGKDNVITLADLPTEVRGAAGMVSGTSAGQRTLKEALEGPERQIIREVLESNNWNRNATADQLGINRTTLYKKMKRLGLEDSQVGVPVAVGWAPPTTFSTAQKTTPPTHRLRQRAAARNSCWVMSRGSPSALDGAVDRTRHGPRLQHCWPSEQARNRIPVASPVAGTGEPSWQTAAPRRR